jgi:hypothetical protein
VSRHVLQQTGGEFGQPSVPAHVEYQFLGHP